MQNMSIRSTDTEHSMLHDFLKRLAYWKSFIYSVLYIYEDLRERERERSVS